MNGRDRIRAVSVKVRRPTEYTQWWPRVGHGIGFGEFVWGVLSVTWEREPGRAGLRQSDPSPSGLGSDQPATTVGPDCG